MKDFANGLKHAVRAGMRDPSAARLLETDRATTEYEHLDWWDHAGAPDQEIWQIEHDGQLRSLYSLCQHFLNEFRTWVIPQLPSPKGNAIPRLADSLLTDGRPTARRTSTLDILSLPNTFDRGSSAAAPSRLSEPPWPTPACASRRKDGGHYRHKTDEEMESLNNSIISLFPPVDRLLAALDVELQRTVLRFVAEATDDRMRGFGITRDGVVIALFGHGGYEADYQKKQSVERVISRAWKALEDLDFIEEPD